MLLLSLPAAAGTGGTLFDPAPAGSQAQDPFAFSARATPSEISAGSGGVVSVSVKMPPGHKLYAVAMHIEPGVVPGLRFGALKTPESVERKEIDGSPARFYVGDAAFVLPVDVDPSAETGARSIPLTVRYRGCSETRCFLPREKELRAALTIVPTALNAAAADNPASEKSVAAGDVPGEKAAENPYAQTARRFGLPGVLAAAFVWGLLASLTPCVYPMIPVTMSVIGAVSTGSLARGFSLSMVYVLGLSVVYAVFGVAAAWSGSLFGAWSDHPAVRIVVAGVFAVLALGLFDLFQIRMPSSVASRLGGKFGGGIIGVFLTGAAAGAVVGPCVGPLLAALLVYVATLADKVAGFLIMWSFALGMGVLFLVVGTFSGAAASLPRSGPWMERLKHAFGVLMLGAALYYVAPLMPDKIVWLCIGALLIGIGTFLGALDALPPSSGGYDRFRKAAGILCLTLGIVYAARFAVPDASVPPPPGISWMHDEAAALAAAKRAQKPVLIDFYADWCAACRNLDRHTFSDPAVIAAAQAFVPLKIDSTNPENEDAAFLRKKYGVVGLPTIVFIGAGGRIIRNATITEFVPPAILLDRMERIPAAFSDVPKVPEPRHHLKS